MIAIEQDERRCRERVSRAVREGKSRQTHAERAQGAVMGDAPERDDRRQGAAALRIAPAR